MFFWMKIIQVTFERNVLLLLLRIGVAKPDFSENLMHGLEKLFGRSINTCFIFSSDFR